MYQFNPNYSLTPQSLNFGQGLQAPMFPTNTASGTTPSGAVAPQGGGGFEFGLNAPTVQMGLNGLNMAGNLWGAWQANKLAREQFDFTKNITNTNLNNQVQTYNTALGDRARARGFTEGRSDQEVQDYVSANRLSR